MKPRPKSGRHDLHFGARFFGTMKSGRRSKKQCQMQSDNLYDYCGIQSYSLNCSQKEQNGSSSLHVRMYALVLAPCINCGGLLYKGTFSTGFSGLVNEPANRQTVGHSIENDFNRSCTLLLRLWPKSCGHNEWRYFRHTWCRARHGGA